MPDFTDFAETTAAADSRETSSEIMQAIAYFERDLSEAEALWAGDGFGVRLDELCVCLGLCD